MAKSHIVNEPLPYSDLDFIKALYRDNENETLFIRRFHDKDKSKAPQNIAIAYKDYQTITDKLHRYNNEGYGIFLVINGGGNKDNEVKQARAQFMEIDDLPFDEQIAIINDFPLSPSIVVRTRKSLHCYWLLADGKVERFRPIQERLIAYFKSDASVKNESRVMRIPAFYHNKKEPAMVDIIHFEPTAIYTQDELESVLPALPSKSNQQNKTTKHDSYKNGSGAIATEQTITKERVNTLISFIGTFKAKGLTNEVIRNLITDTNAQMCKPPLEDIELEREVFPAIDRFPTEPIKPPKFNANIVNMLVELKPETKYKWDDKGNGELFADIFKDSARWNVTAKEWYFYDGKIWGEDTGGMQASKRAKDLADALLVYSTRIEDEKLKESYQKHIVRLGQRKNRQTMLEDAKDKYYITADALDKDLYLLNVQNCVINLKSFEVMEHNPDLLLSKICNAEYKAGATSRDFEKFMNEIMLDDSEKIHYLQKIFGYSLSGDTREETCYILYGQSTRNGKSTLVETIAYMLGNTSGYAMNMKPETLATKTNNDSRQASGDIARLKNCRFLNAAEPPKRMIFDVGLLKSLLGRDSITARFLHQNDFQFVPCFKLFINTNFLPLITDDTLFSSGRLNVITFDKHFEPQEQDKGLKDRLQTKENMSGILNWCLDGLRMFYKEGAKPPQSVLNATLDYRDNSDKMGNFIAERLVECKGKCTAAKDVYLEYQKWCRDNGYGQENKGNFFADLRTKDLMAKTGTINGITVKNVVVNYIISPEFEPETDKNRSPFN